MHIELIGYTQITATIGTYMSRHPGDAAADQLAEFAGRACYQSFHKPNPATQRNADYLANIQSLGHESVLEHSSATFYVQGVSRALTHELIRHRHLSFSELSQRFVNVLDVPMIPPPAIRTMLEQGQGEEDSSPEEHFESQFYGTRGSYEEIVAELYAEGYSRKQAREAARAVMPNATETKIVVTGNIRAWRDVLKKRWSIHADAEIREFAGEILGYLRGIASNSVQDIPQGPYE